MEKLEQKNKPEKKHLSKLNRFLLVYLLTSTAVAAITIYENINDMDDNRWFHRLGRLLQIESCEPVIEPDVRNCLSETTPDMEQLADEWKSYETVSIRGIEAKFQRERSGYPVSSKTFTFEYSDDTGYPESEKPEYVYLSYPVANDGLLFNINTNEPMVIPSNPNHVTMESHTNQNDGYLECLFRVDGNLDESPIEIRATFNKSGAYTEAPPEYIITNNVSADSLITKIDQLDKLTDPNQIAAGKILVDLASQDKPLNEVVRDLGDYIEYGPDIDVNVTEEYLDQLNTRSDVEIIADGYGRCISYCIVVKSLIEKYFEVRGLEPPIIRLIITTENAGKHAELKIEISDGFWHILDAQESIFDGVFAVADSAPVGKELAKIYIPDTYGGTRKLGDEFYVDSQKCIIVDKPNLY